jgi:transcriptional regulator with XRE-family HTH domain
MTTKKLGNVVRYWRKERNMTALNLCRKVEISNSLLSKFETGKTSIGLPILCRILTILDVNIYFQDGLDGKTSQTIK